jgi:hypothetical protein
MADNNITLKRITGSGTSDNLYPRTIWTQVLSKPTTFTPTSHTHGFINNSGVITNTPVTVGSGDAIMVAAATGAALQRTTVTFGTGTTTFLRNDGAWATTSTVTDPFIYTHRTSDSSRTTSTYTTDLEITSLAANSYYQVEFLGTFYKTSTNSAGFRFGFIVSNTTGTPTLFGLSEAATNTTTGRVLQNIYAVGSTIVAGSVIATTSETATTTGRDVRFIGLLYTGTSTKNLSLQTATSDTLTNGAVGLKTGSMLKIRKIN